MKSNKALICALAIVILLAALACVIVYAASFGALGMAVGSRVADAVADNEKEGTGGIAVATINGDDVTKNEFDMYKAFTNYNHDYSDKELLDKMIEIKVLYDEATAEGFFVTDDEINAQIEKVKILIAQDPEQSDFFKNFIDGLGMTEEEYWQEIVFPGYIEVFTINKLSDSLKEKFAEENNITDPAQLTDRFKDYFAEYKEILISKADIKTDIR